jgi:hypothetical protein
MPQYYFVPVYYPQMCCQQPQCPSLPYAGPACGLPPMPRYPLPPVNYSCAPSHEDHCAQRREGIFHKLCRSRLACDSECVTECCRQPICRQECCPTECCRPICRQECCPSDCCCEESPGFFRSFWNKLMDRFTCCNDDCCCNDCCDCGCSSCGDGHIDGKKPVVPEPLGKPEKKPAAETPKDGTPSPDLN